MLAVKHKDYMHNVWGPILHKNWPPTRLANLLTYFLTMHYWSFFFCITMYNHVIHVNTGLSTYQKSLKERRLSQWEFPEGLKHQ